MKRLARDRIRLIDAERGAAHERFGRAGGYGHLVQARMASDGGRSGPAHRRGSRVGRPRSFDDGRAPPPSGSAPGRPAPRSRHRAATPASRDGHRRSGTWKAIAGTTDEGRMASNLPGRCLHGHRPFHCTRAPWPAGSAARRRWLCHPPALRPACPATRMLCSADAQERAGPEGTHARRCACAGTSRHHGARVSPHALRTTRVPRRTCLLDRGLNAGGARRAGPARGRCRRAATATAPIAARAATALSAPNRPPASCAR